MIKTNKRNSNKSKHIKKLKKQKKSKKRINQVKFIGGGFDFNKLEINKDLNRLSIDSYYNEINDIEYFLIIDNYLNRQIVIEKIQEDYIYILHDDKRNQIYVLDNDSEYINDLDRLEGIMKLLQDTNDLTYRRKKEELMKHKINLIRFGMNDKKQCLDFNKDNINSVLEDLNKKIQNKCPELSLKLDYKYKLTGKITSFYARLETLLLCLYYGVDCISSISLGYNGEDTMYINSCTKEDKRGNKYNKLLRCIIIIICDILVCNDNRRIMNIISWAANPISAWLLISNFQTNIKIVKEDEKEEDKTEIINIVDYNEITREFIENLYKDKDEITMIYITIPLNTINVNRANELVDNLLSDISGSIICPPP